jgi:hypothetical protein
MSESPEQQPGRVAPRFGDVAAESAEDSVAHERESAGAQLDGGGAVPEDDAG